MRKKIFYAFFVFLLTMSLASAAIFHSKLSVNTAGGQVIIDSGGCSEDWSGSGWSSCVSDTQFFVCFDKNNCDTTSLRPALCGNSQACNIQESPPPSGGGDGGSSGGGGGGGSSGGSSSNAGTTSSSSGGGICIESWQCTEWSNSNDACGTRSCTDVNKCGTTQLKPETSKKCPSTGLFGITGGAIGALGGFVTSGEGIITFSVITVIIIVTVILVSKKGKSVKKPEGLKNSETK